MDYTKTSVLEHMKKVANLVVEFTIRLLASALIHDSSKLTNQDEFLFSEIPPEKGSPEYAEWISLVRQSIANHNKNNAHHPEAHARGVSGMNLMDIIEMLADWKAKADTAGVDFMDALYFWKNRYGISGPLFDVIINTVIALEWHKTVVSSEQTSANSEPGSGGAPSATERDSG